MTTLDRYIAKHQMIDRSQARDHLQRVFLDQAMGLTGSTQAKDGTELVLLARHHGLPSPIMDWTRSPYVAAFFAFMDATHDSFCVPKDIAIWCIDLEEAADPFGDNIEIIDDLGAIRSNPRAIEQRSVFINFHHAVDLAALPNLEIRKFVLPAGIRSHVLSRLEGMGLNERSLFRSLDAAANVAAWRVRTMLETTT